MPASGAAGAAGPDQSCRRTCGPARTPASKDCYRQPAAGRRLPAGRHIGLALRSRGQLPVCAPPHTCTKGRLDLTAQSKLPATLKQRSTSSAPRRQCCSAGLLLQVENCLNALCHLHTATPGRVLQLARRRLLLGHKPQRCGQRRSAAMNDAYWWLVPRPRQVKMPFDTGMAST